MAPHARLHAALLLFITAFAGQLAHAQGLLVNANPDERVILPRPPIIIFPPHHPRPEPAASSYRIRDLDVSAKLEGQIARVQVSQSFVNTGHRPMEVCFVFPLPYDGAIDQLTLLVDGKEFPAKLLDAKDARRAYEEIVRANRDPALLEWTGTGMFRTSVFPVPPGAERKVTLRYSQLCRTSGGLTDFLFPLATAKYTSQPIEQITFHLTIDSTAPIKNIYSPTHKLEINRPDDQHATVTYTAKDIVPADDFRLFYDVGEAAVGASVLSYRPKADEDGFFLLLASPRIEAADAARPAKTVILVLDRSGSMSGEKIEQAKGAAKFVINNLRDGDLLNIVAYDSEVESWRPELQKFSDETRKTALGFIEGLFPGGSTNINGALSSALAQPKDSSRPNFVIFLTDGLPTVGETNEAKIAAAARSNNTVHARVFDFGVGYDVNSRLLDKLARENFGLSQYVRPNENIEQSVAALYNRIGAPVLTDVKIDVDLDGLRSEDGPAVTRMYPKNVIDLFAGEQLVLVGRYKKPGAAKITVTGRVGDKQQKFTFPATLVEKSTDESHAFTQRLWATRRIGEILDEIDLNGRNEELIKELISLSLAHGIMTPYTSFLADETSAGRELSANIRTADERLSSLQESAEGQSGFELRRAKQVFRGLDRAADAAPSQAYGFGGAVPAASSMAPSYDAVAGAKEEKSKVVENVRQLGSKTFYRRGDRWVDSEIPDSSATAQHLQTKRIERYSQEFFDLVDKHGPEAGKYLSIDEPFTVQLDGTVYEID